jgi:hypothetical protein
MKRKRIILSEFFTRFEAKPEISGDGIPRMLIISEGPAKGHFCVEQGGKLRPYDPSNEAHAKLEKIPIFITGKTLEQVAKSGNARSEVKAKLDQRGDHAGSAADTFGGYSNFRIEGNSVYADLKFLEGTPHRAFVEGIASRFADEFGNSIDFKTSYELGTDSTGSKIAIANCLHLGSVDLVDSPAATNSLFEENEIPEPTMPLSPEDLATIGDMITKAVAAAKAEDKQQDAADIDARLKKLEEAAKPEEKQDADKKDGDSMEEGDKKKDEESEEKLSENASKLVLKVVHAELAKFSKGFVNTGEGDGKAVDAFEAAVQAQLSSGCKNRGLAVQRIASDNPSLYNEAAKLGKI